MTTSIPCTIGRHEQLKRDRRLLCEETSYDGVMIGARRSLEVRTCRRCHSTLGVALAA
jgi:hypothetical protein